jgi:LemA protein
MNGKSSLLGCGAIGLGLVALLVIVAIMFGGWAMSVNNRLVNLQEDTKGKWAQVETVLQRRYDLIPNLVATVKGYAKHEQETLENIVKLRSQWGAAKTVDEKAQAANQMESALSRLLVISEQYPDLKANKNFSDLQIELAGTENRIAVERQRYNESVRAYNTQVRQFPTSFIAGMLGFSPSTAYFDATPAATDAPKVQF